MTDIKYRWFDDEEQTEYVHQHHVKVIVITYLLWHCLMYLLLSASFNFYMASAALLKLVSRKQVSLATLV